MNIIKVLTAEKIATSSIIHLFLFTGSYVYCFYKNYILITLFES